MAQALLTLFSVYVAAWAQHDRAWVESEFEAQAGDWVCHWCVGDALGERLAQFIECNTYINQAKPANKLVDRHVAGVLVQMYAISHFCEVHTFLRMEQPVDI